MSHHVLEPQVLKTNFIRSQIINNLGRKNHSEPKIDFNLKWLYRNFCPLASSLVRPVLWLYCYIYCVCVTKVSSGLWSSSRCWVGALEGRILPSQRAIVLLCKDLKLTDFKIYSGCFPDSTPLPTPHHHHQSWTTAQFSWSMKENFLESVSHQNL